MALPLSPVKPGEGLVGQQEVVLEVIPLQDVVVPASQILYFLNVLVKTVCGRNTCYSLLAITKLIFFLFSEISAILGSDLRRAVGLHAHCKQIMEDLTV